MAAAAGNEIKSKSDQIQAELCNSCQTIPSSEELSLGGIGEDPFTDSRLHMAHPHFVSAGKRRVHHGIFQIPPLLSQHSGGNHQQVPGSNGETSSQKGQGQELRGFL